MGWDGLGRMCFPRQVSGVGMSWAGDGLSWGLSAGMGGGEGLTRAAGWEVRASQTIKAP